MNILTIFLSDLHISSRNNLNNLRIDKLIKSLKCDSKIDRCFVAFGGDMTFSGSKKEFDYLKQMIDELKSKILSELGIMKVYIVMVPGNHDLNFEYNNSKSRDRKKIRELNIKKNWDKLIEDENKLLKDFYELANKYDNFVYDKLMESRFIDSGNFIIRFNLINSALFSILDLKTTENDKALHYIPEASLQKMDEGIPADLVITMSHHSASWFTYDIENKLEKTIKRTTQVQFNGHDHIQEVSSKTTLNSNTFIVRGGEIGIDKCEFSALYCETLKKVCTIKNFIFDYDREIYIEENVTNFDLNNVPKKNGLIPLKKEFVNWINSDEKSTKVSTFTDYFVFPDLEIIESNKFDNKTIISNYEDFLKKINSREVVYLESNEVSGKTTLLKFILKSYCRDKYVLYLNTDDIINKNVNKIIKDKFEEQYSSESRDFEYFKQFEKSDKVLLIDNLHKIKSNSFTDLIKEFSSYFGQTFITIQSRLVEDEKSILKELYLDGNNIRFKILPFFSLKREELIKKVFIKNCNGYDSNIDKKIDELTKIIESQITFFELSPNFIIMFIESFCSQGITHTASAKIFSSTFIANITNSLVKNLKIDTDIALRLLQEIAFYIHENKMYPLKYGIFLEIVNKYNVDYGKRIDHSIYFDAFLSSKILEKHNTDEIKFVNTNHLSYFVAKEIIKHYISTGAFCEVEYLLNNICFGINSTILLFISYLTENENLIVRILDNSEKIMAEEVEMSFDEKNIPFLKTQSISTELSLPSKEEVGQIKDEKYQNEKNIVEMSNVSKVDIYDYEEDEIRIKLNMVIRNYKLIEIISRILPNFESNLKMDVKMRFVEAIYVCTNKMLYCLLKDFDTEQIVDEIIRDNDSSTREIPSKDQLIKIVDSYNVALILSIFDYIASISVSKETIDLLDSFIVDKTNTNYKIQNLLMHEAISNFDYLGKLASELYSENSNKLTRLMISLIIRKHILTKDVALTGKNQKYINMFFKDKSRIDLLYNKQKLIDVKKK